jgi:hypothetical protein
MQHSLTNRSRSMICAFRVLQNFHSVLRTTCWVGLAGFLFQATSQDCLWVEGTIWQGSSFPGILHSNEFGSPYFVLTFKSWTAGLNNRLKPSSAKEFGAYLEFSHLDPISSSPIELIVSWWIVRPETSFSDGTGEQSRLIPADYGEILAIKAACESIIWSVWRLWFVGKSNTSCKTVGKRN